MADEERQKPTDWALYRRFWEFLRPYRAQVLFGLALVPVMTAAELAQPWLLKIGIDEYIMAGDAAGLVGISVLLLGLVLLAYVTGAFQVYLLQLAGVKALGDTRRALYRHVMAQGAAFADRHPTGSLLTRTTTDVESLGETLTLGMVTIFGDVLKIVGVVVAMLVLDVKLTLLTFAVAPVLVAVVEIFRRKLKEYSVVIRKSLSRLNGYLAESMTGIKVIQLFGREAKCEQEFRELSYGYLDAYRRSNWYDASLYAIMDGISAVCIGLMLWYGGVRYLGGPEEAISIGLLVAFIEYISRVFVPIREFSGKFATLQRAVAALERIFGLLDTRQAIGGGDPRNGERDFAGRIEFRDVSFAYRPQDGPVLQGVSFRMEPGRTIALVGATGSGKTTIGKLLTRMYDGYEGSITIDGVELRDIPPAKVHALAGVVHQDVHIFAGTVLDNITLGDPAITREQAEQAARLVHADTFIRMLPQGYDTLLAERGGNLSAGQAQLLAFARAMAHDPPVLVLDEATASIDSLSELLIQQAIERILELKTVLIVAHRLSTIQKSDEILVLERGHVVERGTHETLLARNGIYAELYRTGFGMEAAAA